MAFSHRQAAFSGGELSPSLFGRTDLRQYAEGSRTLRNFIITPRGSAANRPGTAYIASVKNPLVKGVRLIPFILDDGDTYVLEFGNLYIRFYKAGAQILNGMNPYEVVTTYAIADLAKLKFCQVGSVMYLTHGSYAPQTLTYVSDTSWTLANLSFDVPAPYFIGGDDILFDPPMGVADSILAAAPAVTTLNGSVPTYPKDWQIGTTEVCQYNSGAGVGATFETTLRQVSKVGAYYPSNAVFWNSATAYVNGNNVIVDYSGQYYTANGNTTGNWPPTDGGAHWVLHAAAATRIANEYSPPATWPRRGDTFVPDNAPNWVHGNNYVAGNVVTLPGAGKKWWVCNATDNASNNPPPSNSKWGAVGAAGGVAAAAGGGPFGPQSFSMILATPGDPGYNLLYRNVYGGRGGVYGFLASMGVNTLQFFDGGADPDYTKPPPQGRNPFKAYNSSGALLRTENPWVVGTFQQRLVFANTNQRPMWFWGSQVGNPTNFDSHIPGVDSDEYEFRLNSDRYEQIRGFAANESSIFFTSSGGLWVADGSGGPLTRSNVHAVRHSSVGAAWNDPIVVGDVVLYVRRMGLGINEVVFDWRIEKWRANDVTSTSRHLFESHIVTDWAYAREPYGVVWAVREDGVLLSMTYQSADSPQNEQPLPEIKCWSWHDTGPQAGIPPDVANGQLKQTRDAFEAVCVVHEDSGFAGNTNLPSEDAVYVVVRRNINGTIARYVERFYSRQVSIPAPVQTDGISVGVQEWPLVFVDSAVIVTNPGTAVVPGFGNLIGESVMVLADNQVMGPYVVNPSGAIDLTDRYPDPGVYPAQVVAGLPYYSDRASLDVASGAAEIHTKKKTVTAEVFDIAATRGILAGSSFDALKLFPWQQKKVSDSFSPPPLKTGHARVFIAGTFGYSGRACLRQTDPLPLELLGITREVEMGDGP